MLKIRIKSSPSVPRLKHSRTGFIVDLCLFWLDSPSCLQAGRFAGNRRIEIVTPVCVFYNTGVSKKIDSGAHFTRPKWQHEILFNYNRFCIYAISTKISQSIIIPIGCWVCRSTSTHRPTFAWTCENIF